jgi:FkbH-like protein
MRYYIFRNYTLEIFFKVLDAKFSGYEDISFIDKTVDSYIWFYCIPYKTQTDIVVNEILNYSNLLDLVISRIDDSKLIIIFTMVSLFKIVYQTSDTRIENAIFEYNRKINDLAKKKSNIKMIDINAFYYNYSNEQLIDWKYYYLSKIPINPKLAPDFSYWLLRQLEIIDLKRKKCIVLDLDNTLWSGVLGEDGIDGIRMGEDYPGNVFRFFQSYLLELERMGVILTICSKNNEADVLSVWEKHPDMLLHKEHFVAYRINWNNKAENIKDIAKELNIGLDSMVFIDDNPAELELIKQTLPEISIPDFPDHPYLFPLFIKKLTDDYFSVYKLTQDDFVKTRQYKENAEREQYKEQFLDMDGYLRSLEIELTIEKLDNFNITRLAQMTQKTNQFNLTTHRYTESDIQAFAERGALVYGLRVKDRFGDNGLTGLIIVEIDGLSANIDTFLLSCRILGKGIEDAFIAHIFKKLKDLKIEYVTASLIKTKKNEQVEYFYEKVGFKVSANFGDRKDYVLTLDDINISLQDIYKMEER